jgi:hypothetical protein
VSQREAVAFARVLARERRARNGGKLPRGGLVLALKDACTIFAEDGCRLGFDFEDARDELKRRPS